MTWQSAGPKLGTRAGSLIVLEHMGIRWGYVFLRGAPHIDAEDIIELMAQAVEMYLAGEGERNIKCAHFEGRLLTQMRYELIGALGGQRFDVVLETHYGKDEAAFLVSEQSKGIGSAISRN